MWPTSTPESWVSAGAVEAGDARQADVETRQLAEASALESRLDGIDERLERLGRFEEDLGVVREHVDSTVGALQGSVDALVTRQADRDERNAIDAAELGAQIDDLTRRIEQEVEAVGGQLESFRGEIERGAASTAWRLERVEEALAEENGDELRDQIAALEARLQEEASHRDERTRATERAVRKGLAGLGERLVASEEAYLEAGSALRRSIERLGAAVVEADARLAGEPLDAPLSGFVAFAPTADGYRLVAIDGTPPGIGDLVEVPGWDTPLLATRVGASPLPLDRRVCAYLEHPAPTAE